MQSPFKIFRKHQKVALAAVTLMAMIAFGLGDVLRQIGGGGHGPREGNVVFETNIGNLTEVAIHNLRVQRNTVQRFIRFAIIKSHPEYEKSPIGPYIVRYTLNRYGFGGLSDGDMLYKWLFLHEANTRGIVVPDDLINDYIDQVTEKKLSRKKFLEIVSDMQISPKELYDLLRTELVADSASRLTSPNVLPSPEKYWQYFQQLHTRQKIAVAGVPVNSFVDQAGEPTEAQIAKLFSEHQYEYEQAYNGEFRPGFRQPPKVKLQYLEISWGKVEEKARAQSPVTDQEIEDYYENNKITDIRLQDRSPVAGDENTPLDPDMVPEEGEKPTTQSGPKLEGPQDEPKEGTEEKPKPGDKPEGETPAPKSGTEQPKSEQPQETGDKEPGDQAKSPECVGAGTASASDDQDEKTDDNPEAAPAEKSQPPAKPSGKPEEAGEEPEKPVAAKKKTPADGDAKPADPDAEDADEQPETPAKKGEEPPAKPAPRELKFKPLDDDLRGYIRSKLQTERADKLMNETAAKVRRAMDDVAEKFADSSDIKLVDPNAEQLAELEKRSAVELHKIADQLGVKFGETGLISISELRDISEFGNAEDLESRVTMQGERRTIVAQAFEGDALCQLFVSETLGAARYFVWKVRNVPAHVAQLADAGIREQVVVAWKRLAAQQLALKRAQDLAKVAESGDKDFQKALADETVTGASPGTALTVVESSEFSFWQESSVPNSMSQSRPVQLGIPGGVAKAGIKFMQVVFEKLADGQVGVALNDDATIYYVVKVFDRRDADLEEFKDARLFEGSAYASIAREEMRHAQIQHSQRIREKYEIRELDLPHRRQQASSYDDD
jgi:hypothetical protein